MFCWFLLYIPAAVVNENQLRSLLRSSAWLLSTRPHHQSFKRGNERKSDFCFRKKKEKKKRKKNQKRMKERNTRVNHTFTATIIFHEWSFFGIFWSTLRKAHRKYIETLSMNDLGAHNDDATEESKAVSLHTNILVNRHI